MDLPEGNINKHAEFSIKTREEPCFLPYTDDAFPDLSCIPQKPILVSTLELDKTNAKGRQGSPQKNSGCILSITAGHRTNALGRLFVSMRTWRGWDTAVPRAKWSETLDIYSMCIGP